MMLIGNIFFINSVARDVPKRNADPYGITIFNIKILLCFFRKVDWLWIKKQRRWGYPDCMRWWFKWISTGNRGCLSKNRDSAVYHPSDCHYSICSQANQVYAIIIFFIRITLFSPQFLFLCILYIFFFFNYLFSILIFICFLSPSNHLQI